ncbi:eukaryotic translation initiation factor 4E type 3 isoform X2 [Carettochelys insculpta]|uniref:eukaryotic translation initiation factor 4E type 3 isoform X2 n=1 Tax=Carettochelys insculpta TaxID=44489 RepID=UPI003EB77A24
MRGERRPLCETWTYARQEKRLNVFHLRCLRRIFGISWKDRVTNTAILEQAGIPTMHTLLRQRRLRWLGHVHRMNDGRIPKDILYGELASGKRPPGRPQLRYKDVCKRDLREVDIELDNWEELADDCSRWRQGLHKGLQKGEMKIRQLAQEKRAHKKHTKDLPDTQYICKRCSKDCHSRVGLHSHNRRCK